MFLMLDIVLNHTSHHHGWARKAKQGDQSFRDYYYMYAGRDLPDRFGAGHALDIPEIVAGQLHLLR